MLNIVKIAASFIQQHHGEICGFSFFLLHAFNFAILLLEPVATETSRKIFTKDGIKEF